MPAATLPNATAEVQPLPLTIGDTWIYLAQYTAEEEDSDGVITTTAHDLTQDGGATYVGELVAADGTTTALTVGATDDPVKTLATGWLSVSLSATASADLTPGRYRQRVRATWAAFTPAYVVTLFVGDVLVSEVW